MRSLLDVSFLIALFDPDHVHNERAHEWWVANREWGWASCPITENGVIRILSNPNYSSVTTISPAESVNLLQGLTANSDHEFWHDDLTFRDRKTFEFDRIHGSRQLTDLYLLALATKQTGRLVTLDESISITAVKGATADNLCIA